MKKSYQKPMVVIEKFELSQHIAACDMLIKPNMALKEGCTGSFIGADGQPSSNFFYNVPNSSCKGPGEEICYASTSEEHHWMFTS